MEVRDEENQPIDGFGWDDYETPRGNTASLPNCAALAAWRNGKSPRELAGRSLRFAFRLRNCHLYSFRAVNEE